MKQLISLVKGKTVHIGTHWDADGVCSAAIIYHIIKAHAKSITSSSKGEVFRIGIEDIDGDPDIIICTDIIPGDELNPNKVIYIDHHPCDKKDYLLTVHDETMQSCTLLIWNKLIYGTKNPLFVFLTMLGYFGDNGDRENIPLELQMVANDVLQSKTRYGIHNLMDKKQSFYGKGWYYEIEKFVSPLNTGKRMHWRGDVPLELLKSMNSYQEYIYNLHPIAQQLQDYRRELRGYYSMKVKFNELKNIEYGIIECDKNVQGVLCARHMKDKPIMVMNKRNDKIIASMRVPDHIEFDAGAYLSEFNKEIKSLVGGGHEKAGGVTFDAKDLDRFLGLIKES